LLREFATAAIESLKQRRPNIAAANSAQLAFRPVALNFIFADLSSLTTCIKQSAPIYLRQVSICASSLSAPALYLRQLSICASSLSAPALYLRHVMPNRNATPATIASVV
jgi:hypothetical protein